MPDVSPYLQYSFILPAGLTILGWFVVARQTDRREFRKELREQLKELRTSMDEVRLRSAAYWLWEDVKTSGPSAIALSSEVKRLSRYLRNLESAGLRFESTGLIIAIRSLATGGDFQSRSRVRSEADEERLEDLSGAIEDALSRVDNAFYSYFAPSKRRCLRWLPLGGALLMVRE
ncbi:hypothetical protein [Sphingomonas aracearum]|uniref:hypothetical protein n=1 Tax=Sphingomonas aracearum TaxID=2283317 RepID=UPI0011C047AF|nr:hypothetical protein [Sphingomonas aracearum]